MYSPDIIHVLLVTHMHSSGIMRVLQVTHMYSPGIIHVLPVTHMHPCDKGSSLQQAGTSVCKEAPAPREGSFCVFTWRAQAASPHWAVRPRGAPGLGGLPWPGQGPVPRFAVALKACGSAFLSSVPRAREEAPPASLRRRAPTKVGAQ